MTPERLKHCLQAIQRPVPLSQRGLAAWIGVHERQVRRWADDEQYGTVPADIEEWLETVAAFFEGEQIANAFVEIKEFLENHPPPAK